MKQRIVSGITATGSLTIANYIGAIQNILKLQEQYDAYIFVADLHALTVDISPQQLQQNRESIFALYLALGVDPVKATIFYQSDIIEHGIMNWLTLTETTMGELSRMTQFKDKSAKVKKANGTELVPSGLFAYPALMAADILLYNPAYVPVGIDQKQHLELTRDIAQRFNKKYHTNFLIPEPYLGKLGTKIMALGDPTKKMSKSTDNSNDSIFLLEAPQSAAKKILKAVTDSENRVYLSDHKPGIKNLLTIYAALKALPIEVASAQFKNSNYKEFKEAVANIVQEFLIDLQAKYEDKLANINTYAQQGAAKARLIAQENLAIIMKAKGLK